MKSTECLFRPVWLIFSAILIFLQPVTADAHKLNVFAWSDHEGIHGEAVFNGGRRAKKVSVTVEDAASGVILSETRTDEQGNFHVTLSEQAVEDRPDLLIVADSGDGHRGEWPMASTEYLINPESADSPADAASDRAETGSVDEQAVRRIVAEELRRELSSIRQALAEGREKKITVQDIGGGVGCIIGAAGIFAWLHSRKRKKVDQSSSGR